ncbi:MAG: SufD family Fe-S cluster assembly protein [Acidimicrobiales bacterium]
MARRRRQALDVFAAAPVPTGDEDAWRYSRIGQLDLEEFSPVAQAASSDGSLMPTADRFLHGFGDRAGLVVTRDGFIVSTELAEAAKASGLGLGSASADPDAEGLVGSVFGEFPSSTTDGFAALADAFAPDPVLVHVPAGCELSQPIFVVHLVDSTSGIAKAVFPRTLVRLEENAEATVVELLVSEDGGETLLVLPSVELSSAPGARLSHDLVQHLGRNAWHIGRLAATAGRDSTLRSFQASLGGAYARVQTDSVLTGQGGSAHLLAAYFGDGDQMHDFRTLQEHAAPRTTSDLVFKGAVAGSSRSVYNGLIRMRHGAKGANAFQTNRNLVLSDGAHADSVPTLDIQENDVRCSHASAVGPVDEEQRFYLESRGVPRAVAERLILLGFFAELFERVNPSVGEFVLASIAERTQTVAP